MTENTKTEENMHPGPSRPRRAELTARDELYCQSRARGLPASRARSIAGISNTQIETRPAIKDRIDVLVKETAMNAAIQYHQPTVPALEVNRETPRDIAARLGVTDEWIIQSLKTVVETGLDKETLAPVNAALKTLCVITGVAKQETPAEEEKSAEDDPYLNTFKALLDTFDIREEESEPLVPIPGITENASNS